jgi:hypothetical protein
MLVNHDCADRKTFCFQSERFLSVKLFQNKSNIEFCIKQIFYNFVITL